MYVEEAAARQEVSRLKGAGFFADGDSSVEKMCSAIAAMNCHKARFMHARALAGFAIAGTHTFDVPLAYVGMRTPSQTIRFDLTQLFCAVVHCGGFQVLIANRVLWTCSSDALSQRC